MIAYIAFLLRLVPLKLAAGFIACVCCILSMATVGWGQDDRNRDDSVGDPFGEYSDPRGAPEGRFLPPGQRPPSTFRLGIYSRNTPTGVAVTSVNPGSVANSSGIEAQDIIIAVNGYQVGIVNGRTYDIADELARRVDAQGRVVLLVRNHRDGQLVNIPVQFFGNNGNFPGAGVAVFGSEIGRAHV